MKFLKNKKLIITVALIGLMSFFAYRAYAGRPIRFSDNGWGSALTGDPKCFDIDEPDGYKFCGLVGFVLNEGHHFLVGDKVEIQQDEGATNKHYNGTASVVWRDDKHVIIDKGFGENTPPEGGTIRKV